MSGEPVATAGGPGRRDASAGSDTPGAIVVRAGTAGPRAALAGTGLDVWEVVETLRLVGNVPARAARWLEIEEAAVEAAARHAAEHPEVEEFLARERRRADDAQRRAREAG